MESNRKLQENNPPVGLESNNRPCPVCGKVRTRTVHVQRFHQPDCQQLLDEYQVKVCLHCGMVFADGIPGQETFDRYYENRSKYENSLRDGAISSDDADRFRKVAGDLDRYIRDRGLRILEVGASTGGMLEVLKEKGFSNLQGIDPSPVCHELAKARRISVKTQSLEELSTEGAEFDLILILAVLEHVRDVHGFIESIKGVLSSGAFLFVQVPDASVFHIKPDAPFQQFSLEHINFFSRHSLNNLMRIHGFEEKECEQYDIKWGGNCVMPVVDSLFVNTKGEVDLEDLRNDRGIEQALRAYVKKSEAENGHLKVVLGELAASGREIIIWGTGTHTQRLLADGTMKDIAIKAFVDSNPHMQGTLLAGIPILSPSELTVHTEPILISSRCFKEEIRNQIRESLQLRNKIIDLYPVE